MPARNQVCYTTLGIEKDRWTLESYLSTDGYKAWQKVLEGKMDPAAIIEEALT